MAESIKGLCEVPCKVVFDQLREKVPMKVFMWVLGGMGLVGMIMASMLFRNQNAMSQSLSGIESDIKVVQTEVTHLKADVRGIQREIKRFNGNKRTGATR